MAGEQETQVIARGGVLAFVSLLACGGYWTRSPTGGGYGVGMMREGPRSVKILNQMPPKYSRPQAVAAALVVVRAISARRFSLHDPRLSPAGPDDDLPGAIFRDASRPCQGTSI